MHMEPELRRLCSVRANRRAGGCHPFTNTLADCCAHGSDNQGTHHSARGSDNKGAHQGARGSDNLCPSPGVRRPPLKVRPLGSALHDGEGRRNHGGHVPQDMWHVRHRVAVRYASPFVCSVVTFASVHGLKTESAGEMLLAAEMQ